jgi:hypothetical protein
MNACCDPNHAVLSGGPSAGGAAGRRVRDRPRLGVGGSRKRALPPSRHARPRLHAWTADARLMTWLNPEDQP